MHNILNNNQFGFRKGYSTQKAIFELLNDMHLSLNSNEIMGLLFPDISEASDSIGALDGGSPLSPVDFKKWQCPLSLFFRFSSRI